MKLARYFAVIFGLAIGVTLIAQAQTSIPGSWGALSPTGRLALASPSAAPVVPPPVQLANVTASTLVYYVPYQGQGLVPMWQNGVFVETPFANAMLLTLTTTHNATTSEFDVFAVNGSGAPAICTGPAWTNGTTRASAITQTIGGLWVNSAFISACYNSTTSYQVPALQGVYLGSIYTTGSGTTTWNPTQAAATHGSNNTLGIFNAYNRVHVVSVETSSSTGWTYGTATWQPTDGGSSNILNRITFLDGLGQQFARATEQVDVGGTATDLCYIGIDENSITATPAPITPMTAPTPSVVQPITVTAGFVPILGLNFIQPMEKASAGTCTFNAVAANYSLTLDLDD